MLDLIWPWNPFDIMILMDGLSYPFWEVSSKGELLRGFALSRARCFLWKTNNEPNEGPREFECCTVSLAPKAKAPFISPCKAWLAFRPQTQVARPSLGAGKGEKSRVYKSAISKGQSCSGEGSVWVWRGWRSEEAPFRIWEGDNRRTIKLSGRNYSLITGPAGQQGYRLIHFKATWFLWPSGQTACSSCRKPLSYRLEEGRMTFTCVSLPTPRQPRSRCRARLPGCPAVLGHDGASGGPITSESRSQLQAKACQKAGNTTWHGGLTYC